MGSRHRLSGGALAVAFVLFVLLSLSAFATADDWPAAPNPLAPDNSAWVPSTAVLLRWSEVGGADSYELWIDNSPSFPSPSTYTSSQTSRTVALSEGWYYWKVRALRSGSPGHFSDVREFGVDVTPPPVPALLSPPDGQALPTGTPLLRWAKVIDLSGATYCLQIDNDLDFSSPALEEAGLLENAYSVQQALSGGKWYWRVRAVDGAGNGSWSDVWSFLVDVRGPWAVEVVPENGSSIRDNTPVIAARLTDDGAGVEDNVENMQFHLDGTQVSPIYYSADNRWFWYENENRELAEGLHTVTLRVWDKLGHGSEIRWSFRVDRTAPMAPIQLSPVDGSITNDSTPSFDWTDSADLSPPLTYILQLDTSPSFPNPENFTAASSCYTVPSPLSDGRWYWRVIVRDSAGNENHSDIWSFVLDTVPPPAPIQKEPDNGVLLASSTPSFSWSSVPGASRYRLQIDNDPDFSSPVYDNDNLPENRDNFKAHPENALPDGLWYWRVGTLDEAGNAGWSGVRSFLVDTSPPPDAPQPQWPPENCVLADPTPTLRWTSVYDPAGVFYTLLVALDENFSGGLRVFQNLLDNRFTVPSPLPDNTYYWRVQVSDTLGHQGPVSTSRRFTIDTRVEAPELVSPENGAILSNTTPEFIWTDVAERPGTTYTLEVSTSPDFSSTYLSVPGLSNHSYTLSQSLSEGMWFWRVLVRESACDENCNPVVNENVSSTHMFVIDTTVGRPSLLWPPDRSVLRGSIALDWTDVSDQVGPVRYYVFVDNEPWDPNGITSVQVGPIPKHAPGGYPSPIRTSGELRVSEWTLSSLPQDEYYWRVLVADGVPNFAWSWEERSFTVDLTPPNKPAFVTYLPAYNPYDQTINDPTPWFSWENSSDNYPEGGAVTYNLIIDNDPDFSSPLYTITGIPDTRNSYYWYWGVGEWQQIHAQDNIINYLLENSLPDGMWYWTVQAVDQVGNVENVEGSHYLVVDTTPPTGVPTLLSPASGGNVPDNTPAVSWSAVAGAAFYEVQYAQDINFTRNFSRVYGTTTSMEIPVPADGVWYWRVRAGTSAWNWGPWSEIRWFNVDTHVDAPSPLAPGDSTVLGDPTPLLRWTAVTDQFPVTYRVVVDNDRDFSSPLYRKDGLTDNQHKLETSLPDGWWYWKVGALDELGNENWSTPWRFYADSSPPTTPAPRIPENASCTNDNTPLFGWAPSQDISTVYYEIQVGRDFTGGVLYWQENLTENRVVLPDENALPDGTYYWRVRARDMWGHVGSWSEVYEFTVDTQPLTEAPLLTSPASGENTRAPTFRWHSVTGAVGYEIWVDDDPGFSSPEILENTAEPSYTPATPLADGTYYWRVRALDAAGNLGTSWSDTWWLRVDRTVTAPTLSAPASGACENDNRPTFSWSAVTDPSSPVTYRLQISSPGGVVYDNAGIAVTSIEIENELLDNVYYWRVCARDNLGNENWSENRILVIDATPPSSRVAGISPYWQTSVPFTVRAENDPDLSGIENVELWYRYSADNSSWDSWALFGVDTEPPWSWSFTAPRGNGFYQFYSRATDRAKNVQRTQAVVVCGVDTAAPAAPALVSPENDSYRNDNRPRFDWSSVPDLSGVTYTLWIDNKPDFSTRLEYSGIHSSEYTVPETLADNRYYWRVRAVDRAGNVGPWSETRQLVIDTVPPDRPTPLSPDNGSTFDDNTPTFRWTESVDQWSGRENYTLEIDNDPDFSSPYALFPGIQDNEYTIPIELPEDNYYWRVWAFDRAGNASLSESFVIWSHVGAPALCSPENGSVLADSCPLFTWESVSDPSGVTYHLQVDNDPDFSSPVYDNSDITDTSLRLPAENALDTMDTWYWRVSARDGINPENWSATWQFTYGVLGKPVLLSPENDATLRDNTPEFRWENGGNALRYRIIVDDDPDLLSPIDNVLLSENTWTKPPPGYSDGTYYWSVWAIDSTGTENGAENTWQFTINTAFTDDPHLLTPENGSYASDSTPYFSWTGVAPKKGEATISYRLQIDDDSDFSSPCYDNAGLTENWDNFDTHPENSLPDGVWHWRVRAQDNYGNAGPWVEGKFTIDTTPPAPLYPLSPYGYENCNRPTFRWTGGEDPNFLSYWLQVDNDPDYGSPLYDNDNISGTVHQPDNCLNVQGTWYWRVGSRDRAGNVRWSDNWSFTFDNEPPGAPNNLAPDNNALENTGRPTFRWTQPETFENYTLEIDNDPGFDPPLLTIPNLTDNIWTQALPDGTYYWRVRAFDRAGNASQPSNYFKLTIDTRPPARPTLLSPPNNTCDNRAVQTFSWTGEGEFYTIQIARNAEFSKIYHENALLTDNVYTYTFAEDGVFYWRVRARDNAGNVGEYSQSWRLTVDTALPPAPSPVSPKNGENLATPRVPLAWGPVADLSGVTYEVEVDNDPSFPHPFYHLTSIVQSTHTLESALPDGTYHWHVRATDSAGNRGPWSPTLTFTVDTQLSPPALVEPAAGAVFSTSLPVFRWTEPETPLRYTLLIDNDSDFSSPAYENSRLGENMDNFQTHPENALPDGLWYWRVVAVDRAGNSAASEVWWFKIDTRVERPVLLSPENGAVTNDNTPYFDWRAIPDLSGVTYTLRIVRLDGSPEFERGSIPLSEFSLPVALPDNTYLWSVGATDTVGNENWSENWTITIDTEPPSGVPVLEAPDNGALLNTPTLTFGWQKVDADNYRLQIDNDPSFSSPEVDIRNIRDNAYTLSALEALSEGVWYWRVLPGDNAGNAGSWSGVRVFRLDLTSPASPALLAPKPLAYTNDNAPLFRWSAVSDASGVRYRLQIDNDPDFSSPVYDNDNLPENRDNFKAHPENALPDGLWYWRVWAIDNAGNRSASMTAQLFVDTVPPGKPTGLTPSGIFKDNTTPLLDWLGVPDESGVQYLLQISTDNGFENLIENRMLQFSEYPVQVPEGSYHWRVRARDLAGNWGPWSENVHVLLDYRQPLPFQFDPSLENRIVLWIHRGTENEDNVYVGPTEKAYINDCTPTLWLKLSDCGAGLADNFTVEVDHSPTFSSPLFLTLANKRYVEVDGRYRDIYAENRLPGLAEGDWYFRLRAWDNIPDQYGGPHFTELIYHVRVDVTPPPEKPTWLENSWYTTRTPTFRWTEIKDDTGETVTRYQFRITYGSNVNENVRYDNQWVYDAQTGDNLVTFTVPVALQESDNYYRWVRGIDAAGNPGPWSDGKWFGIDVTAPSTSITVPSETSSHTFTVRATATDPLSGVENVELWYRYSASGSSWSPWSLHSTDTNGSDGWSWSFTAPSGCGYYQFYARGSDVAGNRMAEPTNQTSGTQVKYGRTVTVSVDPAEGGSASVSPGTIVVPGEQVTLSAAPASGYLFASWSGDVSGTENPKTFTMPNSDVSVTARFSPLPTYTLTISAGEGGTTDPSPGTSTYSQGSTISIRAIPSRGYRFKEWGGDASGASPTVQITMTSDKSITASFEPVTYTISLEPGEGGSITATPGTELNYDTEVTVQAVPASGYRFVGWGGYLSGTENPKIFRMPDSNITIRASFQPVPGGVEQPLYQIGISVRPPEGGTAEISPGGRVTAGTRVTVTAHPAEGYQFVRWEGDYASTENPYSFTMPAKNVGLYAVFEKTEAGGGRGLPLTWIGGGVGALLAVVLILRKLMIMRFEEEW